MQHIGNTIKILRTIAGLNQEELAEKINKTRSLVSHIEQTGKVNYYTLRLIAKVLNTSVAAIEDYQPQEKSKQKTDPAKLLQKQKLHSDECEELRRENILLKEEIVRLQKKVITLLEKKK
jgi:transcriptional regulator with XRE-family HTH domain